jgi:hypothetical protein
LVKGDAVAAALLAGGGSAAKDAVILLADSVLGGKQRAARASLRSHFMAFGAKTELSSQ